MSTPFSWDRDEQRRAYHTVATQLVTRHSWKLLPPDALAAQAQALIERADGSPVRAVLLAYTLILYAACNGDEGRERQERGYLELYRYLFEIARWRLPDEAEDLAQLAIEMTFLSIGRCREPGAFLRFALFQLQDAARTLRREQNRPVESLARLIGPNGLTLGEILVDEGQPDPAEAALLSDLRERFAACAAECELRHPRAAMQLRAVWLKYLAGLDDHTISANLGKPANLVHVMRSRGMGLLRKQATLRALANDLGISAEPV
ncbi:MAG: sigma-70 family RNA polymerase sigma factor [Chloroflexales bacterium]|nr:sigma-70 family RNA polymerase sigma factor [Chloroflexales bacterium]